MPPRDRVLPVTRAQTWRKDVAAAGRRFTSRTGSDLETERCCRGAACYQSHGLRPGDRMSLPWDRHLPVTRTQAYIGDVVAAEPLFISCLTSDPSTSNCHLWQLAACPDLDSSASRTSSTCRKCLHGSQTDKPSFINHSRMLDKEKCHSDDAVIQTCKWAGRRGRLCKYCPE